MTLKLKALSATAEAKKQYIAVGGTNWYGFQAGDALA